MSYGLSDELIAAQDRALASQEVQFQAARKVYFKMKDSTLWPSITQDPDPYIRAMLEAARNAK